ncbi:hypothetical protein ACTXGQ_18385 [Marinobacter sp. 1Y8]
MLVAVTCTKNDFATYRSSLVGSLSNFKTSFNLDVFFLIIIQDKIFNDNDYLSEFYGDFEEGCYLLKKVNYLSVSRARNDAIEYARFNGFHRLIFHDVSIVYTLGYLKWIRCQRSGELLSGSYEFTDDLDNRGSEGPALMTEFDDFRDNFVCSYVFPLSAEFPHFDERFGPGESSVFASGEDFLFLRQFFKLNPELRSFVRFSGNGILHPPRPKDNSKQLAYAKGQGKIHQIFLLEEKSLYSVWRCALFFGNALCRALLFRKNWLKILFLRIKGFLDTHIKV